MKSKLLLGLILAGAASLACADSVRSQKLSGSVHVIFGQGGNIAVIEQANSLDVVDTQFAEGYGGIKKEIAKISAKPVRYVINTHGHNDHTNGNAAFVADHQTSIIAHRNTFDLMKAYNQTADKPNKLPDMVFDRTFSLETDDEPVRLTYFPNAHTNGDIIVHLPQSNVIHAGDILFFGRFPFIDVKNGGSIDGMINGLKNITALADEQTKIIAGHGKVANRAEVARHTQMLETIKQRVAGFKREGKALAQIQAARPAKEWEKSHNWNFINHEKLVESIYQSLP